MKILIWIIFSFVWFWYMFIKRTNDRDLTRDNTAPFEQESNQEGFTFILHVIIFCVVWFPITMIVFEK